MMKIARANMIASELNIAAVVGTNISRFSNTKEDGWAVEFVEKYPTKYAKTEPKPTIIEPAILFLFNLNGGTQ